MDFTIRKPAHILALLVLLFAFFLLIISPILSIFGTLPSTNDIQLSEWIIIFGSIIAILIFIGTPYLWYLLVNKYSIKQMFQAMNLRKKGLLMASIGALIAVTVMYIIVLVLGIILTQYGAVEEEVTNIQDLAGNLTIGSMIFIILFQSTSEEIFFRGFLLEKINSFAGKPAAILITALLFGLAHLSYGKLYPAVMTIILGLILGYLVLKTKNLYSAIIAHILFNTASFTLYYLAELLEFEALIL
jgi:membrane protease YdiL (CAAX protease family)